ncbi:Dot/Icm type IV secretion system ATPase DotB [Candidatus Comchoanobacter bicostacola]|uniref:Dot/Icm type IV secretion system ATPase DotB n=1 Tax=Candidatus Comchoanobacter bicostacola TaxID=2919598 RepID=A0ABY5DK95_9GAMM|nr:Dot/Icm type IV secretion system ATPase DotB [Candidatus Comchoanobacter bicostacola]UTC24413.1 Dot/Icm type IV secretion system ATPase DotB [Candidatus Comchoanobacter bicostacola]
MAEDKYLMTNEPGRFAEMDLNIILEHCSNFSVSDITLQSGEYIYIEEYGKLHPITKKQLTTAEVGDILNGIYGANGTTRLLSGEDIDTNYEFKPSRAERLRFRVNATACLVDGHEAIQITMRTIPTDPPTLKDIGLEDNIIKGMAPNDGVVYVTGVTGSGKSTLLAGIIRSIAEDKNANRKILTYESPIEFVYDNIEKHSVIVSQSEVPKHLPSFAHGVRNALRRKPRLILVGESRDYETINAVIDAALTGHPVYTTVHSNGVAETIRRLVGSFPLDERLGKTVDIIETVRLVIWQKLVPSTDGKQIALREYLVFDEAVREELLNSDLSQVTQNIRKILKKKKQTMLDIAKVLHKQKKISNEVLKSLEIHEKSKDRDLKS